MAYLTVPGINAWLAATKYTVSGDTPEPELENGVVQAGFARLSTRYATSDWVDTASTPELVLIALQMLYAAWWLQRQISDDDLEEASYSIRLENRAWAIIDGILNDTIDIPGVDPDPDLVAGKSALFFPTDESTQLAIDDPCNPDATPRVFAMNKVF